MLKKILIALGVVVLAFVLFAATRPATYHVERATSIVAPAAAIFAYTNDLHKWGAWSPWEKLDPAAKKEYSGPETGVGSSYHWVGNKDVGEGNLTIQESVPNEKVGMKLEFIKPFAAVCAVGLTTKQDGETTRTTWTIDGTNNFIAKAMSVFMSMDKMMGKDFESGLANLKKLAEDDAKKAAAPPVAAVESVPAPAKPATTKK